MEFIGGGKEIAKHCRQPEIMADAAYVILTRDSKSYTGNFVTDEAVLKEEGVKDFDHYSCFPNSEILQDFFLDDEEINAEDTIAQFMKVYGKIVGGKNMEAKSE